VEPDGGGDFTTLLSGPKTLYDRVVSRWIKLGLLTFVIGSVLFGSRCAWAHHSFASTYSSETVTIQGTVVEFLFRNPHSAVLLMTSGPKGETIMWAAEWGTAGQLSRQGIEKDTIQPGDRVTISGNPSRNAADHRMRMAAIARPSDGWKWKSIY
jgi:uncharacterized protein DUF6152